MNKFNPGTHYHARTFGSSLENGLKRLIAVRPATWKVYSKIFKLIIDGSKLTPYPVLGNIYSGS